MATPSERFRLRSELETLVHERDAALAASAAAAREADAQRRQLMAEQDRFVSHLIEAHDRDVKHLREELAAAREAISRLQGEVTMARAMLDDAIGADTVRYRSVQPYSGPHQKAAAPDSGIVGRLATQKARRGLRR